MSESALSSRRVLVVDDDGDLRDSLVDLLEEHGYEALPAATTSKAISIAAMREPAVAVIDICLGDGDGVALLRELKTMYPRMTAVMITGHVHVETAIAALREGAYDYLHKPVHPEQLLALLDRCFQLRSLEDAHRAITQKLASSEQRNRFILRSAPDGIVVAGADGTVELFNDASAALFGYEADEVVAKKPLTSLFSASFAACMDELRHGGLDTRTREVHCETSALRCDGEKIPVEISMCAVGDGAQHGVTCVVRDIRERLATEARLRQAAAVFEHATDAIVILDQAYRIVDANRSYCALTKTARDEAVCRTLPLMTERVIRDSVTRSVADSGEWRGEWHLSSVGEEVAIVLVNVSAVRDGGGRATHYIAVMTDITDMKRKTARIDYLAHHDALTGLPNRRMLVEHLQKVVDGMKEKHGVGGILFVDLDRFKDINDGLGHGVGDELLCMAATRLRNVVGKKDMVARLGGDEFVIVLEKVPSSDALENAAKRVLRAVDAPFAVDGHELYVTASVGIVTFSSGDVDAQAMLKHADAAMYQAKSMGRNRHQFYSPDLTKAALDRVSMDTSLRQGLRQRAFSVVFQPIVDVAEGDVIAVEALVRWRGHDGREVPPEVFIPVAEYSGVISELGDEVLRMACAETRAWRGTALRQAKLSINLSARQLARKNFVERFLETVAAAGADPGRIEVEVTEKVFLDENDSTERVLAQLREAGVGLALDDFGTGYATIACVRKFPFTTLKIDRSFVKSVTVNKRDAVLCSSIVDLAHNLKLRVVAEGVENREQVQYLREAKCDLLQGYYFGRPMTTDVLLAWEERRMHRV